MRTIITILLIYFAFRVIRRLLFGPRRVFVKWQHSNQSYGNRAESPNQDGVYGKRNDSGNNSIRTGQKKLDDIQDADFEEIKNDP